MLELSQRLSDFIQVEKQQRGKVYFINILFEDISFAGLDLTKAYFTNCTFINCDFRDALFGDPVVIQSCDFCDETQMYEHDEDKFAYIDDHQNNYKRHTIEEVLDIHERMLNRAIDYANHKPKKQSSFFDDTEEKVQPKSKKKETPINSSEEMMFKLEM